MDAGLLLEEHLGTIWRKAWTGQSAVGVDRFQQLSVTIEPSNLELPGGCLTPGK